MIPPVDLVVPVKPLHLAKTRLRADLAGARAGRPCGRGWSGGGGVAAERGWRDPAGEAAHRGLALALIRDTLAAARAAAGVRRVVAICSDPAAVAVLRSDGVEVIPDEPDAGLNPALRHGADLLRAADADAVTGALQSDLPALRPDELAAAVAAALAAFGLATAGVPDRATCGSVSTSPGQALPHGAPPGRAIPGSAAPGGGSPDRAATRAFCADRAGTGTTLLVAAPGMPLDPRFGPGSARAHAASGAWVLDGPWPTLRCDVDTEADLAEATRLGLGPHTAAALAGMRM